jgi:hypothetical protein
MPEDMLDQAADSRFLPIMRLLLPSQRAVARALLVDLVLRVSIFRVHLIKIKPSKMGHSTASDGRLALRDSSAEAQSIS